MASHQMVLQANEKLDDRLNKYKAAATGVDMVEKVVTLETELAEATEANNMYKSQLRRYCRMGYKPTFLLWQHIISREIFECIRARACGCKLH